MKLQKQLLMLLIGVFSLYSCENVVDIDVPEKPPKLVLNAYISPDSLWQVNLSHSKYVLDSNDYREISHAEVSVFENGQLMENLIYQVTGSQYYRSGYYRSVEHKPQPGNIYRIEAKVDGYETIWAETSVPEPVIVENFTIDTSRIITRDYESGYKLTATFKDPPGIRNYYQVELFAKSTRSNTITYWDENGVARDSIHFYQNKSSVYISPLDPGISEEQFGYGNAVLFSDGRFNGNIFKFEFLISEWYVSQVFDPNYASEDQASLIVVLRNVDEAMYLYETTADLQDWNSDNPFAEPVPVFSNVENGYGVLGSYAANSNELVLKK